MGRGQRPDRRGVGLRRRRCGNSLRPARSKHMNIDNGTDDLWWPEDSMSPGSLGSPASPEAPPPRPKRRAKTWIVAGLAALAIAAMSAVVINIARSHTATAGWTATGVGPA